MTKPADDPVARCLGGLLRHPEPLRDIDVERALLRLQAARADAAYLLLHRVLVLETALQALSPARNNPPPAAAATSPAPVEPVPKAPAAVTAAAPAAVTATATRSFVRDAAAVAAGVVAGQVLWQALVDDPAADGAEGPDFDLGL